MAYTLDANNNPIATTARTLVSGADLEGGTIDPLTGDFLATFTPGAQSEILEVSGFAAPVPEPSALVLLAASAIGFIGYGLRQRKPRLFAGLPEHPKVLFSENR
jgi:hypothetical protein